MKVAFFTGARIGKGGYIRCFMLAKHLKSLGNDIYLVCHSDRLSAGIEKKKMEDVNVVVLPSAVNILTWAMAQPVNMVAKLALKFMLNPDVVHVFSVVNPSVAFTAAVSKIFRVKRAKLFVDWEDQWGRGGLLAGSRKLFETAGTLLEEGIPLLADGVTVVSQALLQRAIRIGVPKDKVFHIPNGSDIDFIRPLPKEECRRMLGLPSDKIIVTHVGYVDLHETSKRVLASSLDVLFLIVGSPHPIYKRGMRRVCEGTVCVGDQPRSLMPLYLAASDVFLLSTPMVVTDSARWPIRLGEYLAAGRPIIAGDVGEIGRVIREGSCGLLAKPDDPANFADKILQLADNPSQGEKLGMNGRRLAEMKYNWQLIAQRLKCVYELVK